MKEITQSSPQDMQPPECCLEKEQRPPAISRTVLLSLLVFVLSFVVLFAGPALALRLMAGPVERFGLPEGPGGYFSSLSASAAVTEVILQQGRVPLINGNPTGAPYAGTRDTYINRWKPTENFGGENRYLFGQSRAYRLLIDFDLTPALIPPGVQVVSAHLGIYCYGRNIFDDMQGEVYKVIRHWEPNEATWERAAIGAPWAVEGCDNTVTDREPTPVDTRTLFVREAFHYFNVTSIVQDWVDNPASQEGFILIGPDPAVIYYYYSSRYSESAMRPQLIITWTVPPPTTPTPTPTPTRTPTRTPTPTPPPGVLFDETSVCYSHFPPAGVWQTGTTGGYGGNYEYESTSVLTATARWAPCEAAPIPADGLYEVWTFWSVHTARPTAVPYEIHYTGGTTTVYVDQTKNIFDQSGPAYNFTESGWYSLGVYPFRAGTYTTTGEYVELNTSSPGDTCADAVRWEPVYGVAGPAASVVVTANPPELPSDGSATSTIAVTVTDMFGNLVEDGTMVGITTSLGTLPYTYTEAESAAVIKLPAWSEYADPAASGGKIIYSDNFGDEVSWTFYGPAVSIVYVTNVGGGVADVIIDGMYAATINFAGPLQWQVERQIANNLSPGPHTLRVRNGGVGRIWLDAFRSGTTTTGGVATAALVAPTAIGTAVVRAVAIPFRATGRVPNWPEGQTTVSFPGPNVVWVDDNYCNGCPNDGHLWNYDAFNTIQGGVNKVLSGGIVYVLAGTYPESVTIAKPLSLLGVGSDVVVLDGPGTAGSRGFYVDRADNVTISGFRIQDYERGVYLRGTGTASGPRVYNATVTNNSFENNNAGGSNAYALYGSYVYTSTLCSNDIAGGYHGIYLENAYGTVVCYNDIFNNLGVAVRIETGDDNSIDNNHIYANQDVGVELGGTIQRNGIFGNTIQDQAWDGVLVRGTGTSVVDVVANVIERTNLSWRNASGPPDADHNLGGIALVGVTNASIYDNRISEISNAGGNRPNAAGISLRNSSAPLLIERNLIQNCAGHGIHMPPGGGVATVHGNNIYGNARFGVNNTLAANVHVEGNWWGCDTVSFGPGEPADIYNAGTAFWSPQISLTLSIAPPSMAANGTNTANVTATATGFGYKILDGTLITFTSDLGTLVFPSTAAFGAGQVQAILRAGTIADVATVTGTVEPGRCPEAITMTLTANAPHHISATANPITISNSCNTAQNRSVVTATVRDVYNNPVPNVPVTFTSNALGTVFPPTGLTAAGTGEVTTTFTAGPFTGTGIVTATAGTTLTTSARIAVTAGPPVAPAITASPACPDTIPANGVATSTITVTLADCVGNPVPDGTLVGFTTTLGTIVNYEYVEAESASVIKSAGWSSHSDGSPSGGFYIRTNAPGANAYWVFRGEAVSLIYRRISGGGVIRVRVDGGTPIDIDTSGTPTAWVERVVATNLNPAVNHQIEVSYLSGGFIRIDAFRSGAASKSGVVKAILRAPVLSIMTPGEVHTGTVHATTRVDIAPALVVTKEICFGQADIVWVDDDWAGLGNGTAVMVPGGTATIGSDAFDTIPKGVSAAKTGGTVYVLSGDYPRSVAGAPIVITRTLNLLGSGSQSTSYIIGPGSGTGIQVDRDADGTVIEGFAIRNFGYGVVMDGRSGNRLLGITFAENVITGCSTAAITGTYVNDGYFANNLLYSNSGYGLGLYTGNNNQILNNEIYSNAGFGIHLHSAATGSTGNVLSYNYIHDVDWNGIVIGENCANTLVSQNTVHTTNRTNSPAGFNEGGIVLYSTTNSTVERNQIWDVRAAGASLNTAGLWIGGTDAGAVIRYNSILNNVNDGVLLFAFNTGTPPVINCNHIYGNGRFGMRNLVPTPPTVNAEGNWWGRNPPLARAATAPPARDIYRPPDNVDWDPPIVLTLTAAQPTVDAGGPSIVLTATACGGGCCVFDGMPITFTTNLGLLGSPPGSSVLDAMGGGRATVMFTPGIVAGVATITATLPNNGVATTTVTILPLDPASVSLVAHPTTIEVATSCSLVTTSTLTATVRDIFGNAVIDGTQIDFTSTLGLPAPLSSNTIGGVATSTLYSGGTPGPATVRASWSFLFGSASVQIVAGPPFTITSLTANPTAIPGDGVSTSLITAIVVDEIGNAVPDGSMVGFTATHGSVIYGYAEAEGPAVAKAGTWSTLPSATASGGQFIQANTAGASASWAFRGQAVSVRYARNVGNGRVEVRIDGNPIGIIDTSGPGVWHEQVLITNLSAAVPHTVTVLCLDNAKNVQLDAFRSGATTSAGRATAILTSRLLPPVTSRVWATAIGCSYPTRTVDVPFLRPSEVWVDDNYCLGCFNDGHIYGYDAFSNIPSGVDAVSSGGVVHVLAGTYTLPVTIAKPLFLDGAGSASTFINSLTAGTGTGIRVTGAGDGTTIAGFTISRFNLGLNLDGSVANPIQGITFTNSVITACATGGITGTYVHDGLFRDNTIARGGGFGFDLDTGNRNIISYNHIHNITGFGLRVRSSTATATGNILSYNQVHDVSWDGIRVSTNAVDTQVLSNTVYGTNAVNSPTGFNGGGIVLNQTTNSLVEYNYVHDVGTAGGSLDTAGVWIGGNNTGGLIRYNRILNNRNDGILLAGFLTPPEVHCNHIYGNGRHGLRNNFGTPVHAEDNWWGHNPPLTFNPPGPLPVDIGNPAAVFWSPTISVTLTPAQTTVRAGGPAIAITTTACAPSCCIFNGTPVTFTTNLGGLGSPPGAMAQGVFIGGQAVVMFTPGSMVGTATITATVPNAGLVTTTVTITAGLPYSMAITANPAELWPWNCRPAGYPRRSTIGITVTDAFGNPNVGEFVTYTLGFDPGSGRDPGLAWTTGVLDSIGYHQTMLDAGDRAGTVVVTATVEGLSRSVPVVVVPGVPCTSMDLAVSPTYIAADGVSTATITATVYDDCGNLAYDGTMVGFDTSRGTMLYDYAEAEDATKVVTSTGGWASIANSNASGGYYLQTNSAGANASWTFRGSAVSVVYMRANDGGRARVLVDGNLAMEINMYAASQEWRPETVAITGLDPNVPHTIRVERITGWVYLDALRSGTTTVNGVATALLTSEPISTTAHITATAVDSRVPHQICGLSREITVAFERADLAISKLAHPIQVPAGDTVDFMLHYTNTGRVQATQTVISDTLPISLTYFGSESWPMVGDPTNPTGNVWVWNVGNVPPGASGVITLTADRVDQLYQGWVTNTVTIRSRTVDVDLGDQTATRAVEFVPGPPFLIRLSATPSTVYAGDGIRGQSTIAVTVTDRFGTPAAGRPVSFTWSSDASIVPAIAVLNSSGYATTTFTSGCITGTATVTATVEGVSRTVSIQVLSAMPYGLDVSASPAAIPADGVSTSTITALAYDACLPGVPGVPGRTVPDGTMVGFVSDRGSLIYGYVEAEDPTQVITSTGQWTRVANANASGGAYLQTNVPGAWARWFFRGSAVSVIYRRATNGGQALVLVDGLPVKTVSMLSSGTEWQLEWVMVTGLDPSIVHQVEVQYPAGGTGYIFLDALRSGTTTVGGVSTAVLTSERAAVTATVTATVVDSRVPHLTLPERISRPTTVQFERADLIITKGAYPARVPPGGVVTFTLFYSNTGRAQATNTFITDTLPLQLTYVSSTSSPALPAPSNPIGNVWVWNVGNLQPNSHGVITITASRGYEPYVGPVTNTASIRSLTLDTGLGDQDVSAVVDFVSGPPQRMTFTADPLMVFAGGAERSRSTLRVWAEDIYGNPCVGYPVTFTWSSGFVAPALPVLNLSGYTTTTFTSSCVTDTAWITASVGALSSSVAIEVQPGVPTAIAMDRSPVSLVADGLSTSIITATVRDRCGNLVVDGTMVGFETNYGSVPHAYVEGESAEVVKSVGDWTTPSNVNASGGAYLRTDQAGAWARWSFYGSAISLVYRRAADGGQALVIVDGIYLRVLDMYAPSTEWRRETVLFNGLNPATMHTVQIERVSGAIYVDALRSGTTTVGGVATTRLTPQQACATAEITATAVEHRLEAISGPPSNWTSVDLLCADLTISKSAYPLSIASGELVTFTLRYANNGPGQATDTKITDTLPISLTLVRSTSSPDVGNPRNPYDNVWVWDVGNVPPSGQGVITFTARAVCAPGLGTVMNSVEIGSRTYEIDEEDNSSWESVDIVVGRPFTVQVTATPQSIRVESSATIRITVYDACGNVVPATTVHITTSLGAFNATGTLTYTTRTTNLNGQVTLTFYSYPPVRGTAVIRATAGDATGQTTVDITIGPAARTVVVADPTAIPADGFATSTITARVLDTGGYDVPDGFFVGFTTTCGSLLYNYVEESQVNQSPLGSWTTASNPAASGGQYIYTSVDGASVYWNFYGNAVSIIYELAPGGGRADVYIDGNPVGLIEMNNPSVVWRAERIFSWSGSPTAAHTLRLVHRPGTGPIFMDAFRSGVTTSGSQAVAVLTSATSPCTATVAATAVSQTLGLVPTWLQGFVDVRIEPADLVITKTIQPAGVVSIGQRITFTIEYRNLGPSTATGAYIDDVISDGLLSTGWLRDVFFSTAPLTVTPHLHYWWSLGDLPAGQGGTITFGGTIDVGRRWPSETVITNTATIGSSTHDNRRGNNTSRPATTIVPSAPFTITLTATPTSIPVSGNTSALRAEVRDVYGNLVANGTPVTFTTNLGGFPAAQQRVRTTTDGVATTNLTSGTVAGTATITATVDSLSATTRVVFTPLAPFTVTVTANPDEIPVGGASSLIDARVVDLYGNHVADGTVVTFTTTAGMIAPDSVTTLNGRASTVLFSGDTAITATVRATSLGASGTTLVRFVPGVPRVTVSAFPRTLTVGGTSAITVTAIDELGNPVLDGTRVTLTTSLGNFTDSMISTTFKTTVGGRAYAALRSIEVGTALVQATVITQSGAVAITFVPGEPHSIDLVGVEPAVLECCVGRAIATAIVRDRYGNPVADGTVVIFDVTPQGHVEPIDGGRTTNGVARAIISAGTVPGPGNVWAWPERYRSSVVDQFAIAFVAGPPEYLDLSVEPPNLMVGGSRATVKLHMVDCGGNPVKAGTVVTFSITSGGGTLSPAIATTERDDGWAFSALTSPDVAGSATIRAVANGREATAVVRYIPGPPFEVTLTADPLSIAATGMATSTVHAQVRDRYGNHVQDRTTVVFSTDLGRFETGPSFSTSTLGGQASAILTSSTTPGVARVAATSGGRRGEIFVDFYYSPTPTPTPTPPTARWSVRLPMILRRSRP